MIPFGEFAPDIALYNMEVAQTATNVLPGINSYLPLKTLAATGEALDAPCVGAVTLKDDDLTNYIYAGDATKLYGLTTATSTDYSKALGYTDNAERWYFEKWGNQVIASKFGDTPQIMTLGGTTFADLSGTPPQGRTVAVVRDFVVFGNTYDATGGNQPQRVWWSGFDDETQWTAGTNQSNYSTLQGTGGNIQMIVGGEYGIIFQEKSIWRMDYEGVPTVWRFDEVEPGRGTSAPGSVVEVGADIYFLGQDGFYVLQNGTVSEPIGNSKVDRYLFNDLDESNLANITSAVNPETGHIFWAYPSGSATNGKPDKILIYNYKIGRWSTAIEDIQILFTGVGSVYTLEELDSFGTVDTISTSFDSAIWQGGAFKLGAFNSSNQLSAFSGDYMTATIETGQIYTEGKKTEVSSVRPIIDGTVQITMLTKNNLTTDTELVDGPIALDGSGKADFRTNARYHRIRATVTDGFTHAMGVEPVQVPTDDR
jgi:hypothetical protein